jgi:hypothetical protein
MRLFTNHALPSATRIQLIAQITVRSLGAMSFATYGPSCVVCRITC